MLDDDNVFNFADAKREKDWNPENAREIDGLKFAISTAILDHDMISLVEILDQFDGEEYQSTQTRIAEIQQQKQLLSEILEILPATDMDNYKQLIEKDLVRLSYMDRWKIYSNWKAETSEILAEEINSLNVQVLQQNNEMKDVETIETAEIIREAHVVGITTTGAAKNRALLEHLKSKIGTVVFIIPFSTGIFIYLLIFVAVVVEEAAEVLEAHIVTSMSSSCEHLILIGKH